MAGRRGGVHEGRWVFVARGRSPWREPFAGPTGPGGAFGPAADCAAARGCRGRWRQTGRVGRRAGGRSARDRGARPTPTPARPPAAAPQSPLAFSVPDKVAVPCRLPRVVPLKVMV